MKKLNLPNINDFETFIFDLDGTLYLGEVEIKGSSNFIKRLIDNKKNVYVITNNSSKTALDYWEKLKKMKIILPKENVINSTVALIKWLKINKLYKNKFYILGTKAMKKQMAESGIKQHKDGNYVIIGNNTELNWEQFVEAAKLIIDGAQYIVSNPDLRMPLENHYYSPDAGAISIMMEHTTGKKPLILLGKPNKEIIEPFINGRTILYGDRIYTDMECAKNAHISNALVLSGESTYDDYLKTDIDIDFVLDVVNDSK